MTNPALKGRGKVYFASDFHLGVPDYESSLVREKLLVDFLTQCSADCSELFLMGDVFDFWFEYRTVVPKGYVRLLGKLAEMADQGIKIHLFTGNHDIWAFSYLQDEIGVEIHRHPKIMTFNGKTFYLAHGDGLGPGDKGYKFLKKVFSNRFNQWLFSWLHPDIGARLALYFSRKSRLASIVKDKKRETSPDIREEMLYKFCTGFLSERKDIDYFIFGHRHLPTDISLNSRTRMVILGDWLTNFTYACFDGENLDLKYYPLPNNS
jgi:UDP-2,3-diacylglucosamine hydrolase